MLTLPETARRKKQPYLAIRSSLTMRQIKKQGPLFLSEVRAFMEQKGYDDRGPAFFRYDQIDEGGQLEMEFGYFTGKHHAGAGPVRSGILPSGRYITVVWQGTYDRLADVTAMLVGWAKETGVSWDVERQGTNEIFAGRLEIYHDDLMSQPDPAKWRTEVAIKVADNSPD